MPAIALPAAAPSPAAPAAVDPTRGGRVIALSRLLLAAEGIDPSAGQRLARHVAVAYTGAVDPMRVLGAAEFLADARGEGVAALLPVGGAHGGAVAPSEALPAAVVEALTAAMGRAGFVDLTR